MAAREPLFGIFPTPNAERSRRRSSSRCCSPTRLGLDLVGIQDHPYQRRFLDTWSLIAFLAARTERIRFFPDVANLPLRPPAVMAKAAATHRPPERRPLRARPRRGRVLGGRSRAMGGPVAHRAGVGRRARGGDRGDPADVERRADRLVRRRALLARRPPPRPAAGARHRHLARRLRAADGARWSGSSPTAGSRASRGCRSRTWRRGSAAIDEAARAAGRDPARSAGSRT